MFHLRLDHGFAARHASPIPRRPVLRTPGPDWADIALRLVAGLVCLGLGFVGTAWVLGG